MDRQKKFGPYTVHKHWAPLYSSAAHFIKMLVLYETALGYCLFKLTDSAKLKSDNLWEEFESPEKANSL